MYQVTCQFIGGSAIDLSLHEKHEQAWEAIQIFCRFHQESHRVNKSPRKFRADIKDTDTVIISELYNNKYHPEGLFAVLRIKETTDYLVSIQPGLEGPQ